jgi:hypothetical protein
VRLWLKLRLVLARSLGAPGDLAWLLQVETRIVGGWLLCCLATVVQALMLMEIREGIKSMTIAMRVQERQGETNMNLACVILGLSALGLHVFVAVAGRPKTGCSSC